jgi:hypothetical protein
MHQSVYEGMTSFSPHSLPAQLLILPFPNPHPFLLSSLSFPGLGFGVGSGARCPRTWCSGVAVRVGRRGPASVLDAPDLVRWRGRTSGTTTACVTYRVRWCPHAASPSRMMCAGAAGADGGHPWVRVEVRAMDMSRGNYDYRAGHLR